MKFTIVFKQGLDVKAELPGRELPGSSITMMDLQKVIETEALLERLLGYRVHINQS